MLEKNEFNQVVGCYVENWVSPERPGNTILHGKFCILDPLEIHKHADKLFDSLSIDNQGESWTYLPYGPFNTCDEFQDWLQKTISDNDTLLYAILDIQTKRPIGIAGYLRINPEHGVIEVGHLHFSKLLKRTPIATEAMYLMMHYALEELKYRRYEWKCHSLNLASRAAALRLGFTFEGIFRQSNVFKNRNRDTAWFSILDNEWPTIREKFKKWLQPSNFNSNGGQIVSLREI
jgi:RimJ/RimL family protein N-acetyltransferase